MIFNARNPLAFVILLLLTLKVHSQNEIVRTALQLASFNKTSISELYIGSLDPKLAKKERQTIRLSRSNLAPKIGYKGPKTFFLFENKTPSEKEKPMARVALPHGIKSAIILLFPSKKGPFQSRGIVIDGSKEKFPQGSRYMLNVSGVSVRAETGKMPFVRGGKKNQRFICSTGKSKVVPALDPNAENLTGHPIIIEYQNPKNEWATLAQTRWFHTPELRHLILVSRDPRTKRIQFKGLIDGQADQKVVSQKTEAVDVE